MARPISYFLSLVVLPEKKHVGKLAGLVLWLDIPSTAVVQGYASVNANLHDADSAAVDSVGFGRFWVVLDAVSDRSSVYQKCSLFPHMLYPPFLLSEASVPFGSTYIALYGSNSKSFLQDKLIKICVLPGIEKQPCGSVNSYMAVLFSD